MICPHNSYKLIDLSHYAEVESSTKESGDPSDGEAMGNLIIKTLEVQGLNRGEVGGDKYGSRLISCFTCL